MTDTAPGPVKDDAGDPRPAETPAAGASAGRDRTGPAGRRAVLRVAAALAAAWVVPVVTHLLSADVVLLPLMVLAAAAVLRAGRSTFDRLMIAGFTTAAGIIVFGLVYSAWPWGLSPIAIAGTWFTGVIAVSVLAKRPPRIPRPGGRAGSPGTDLLIVAAGIAGALWARWPVIGRSLETSLKYTSAREDMFRHFSLFDAIQAFGGYPLFNEPQVQAVTADMDVYPPGAHFLYAVLDTFVRSSTGAAPSTEQFWHYYGYTALGYGLLAAAAVWAARWIAGPVAAGWRRAVVCAIVAVFVCSGALTTLFWQGYDSEIIGLGLLAVTFALLVRPPSGAGATSAYEWVTLVSLLAAATVITYNLFVLFLPAAALAAVVAYRKRLLPVWKYAAVAVAVAGIAASFVFWQQLAVGLGPSHTNEIGGIVPFDRGYVAGLGLLVIAALLTHTGRRVGVWPVTATAVGAGLLIVLGFAIQQLNTFGETRYYLEKLIHVVYLFALVGLGAAALFLKPWRRLGLRRQEWVPSLAALVVVVVAAGIVPMASPTIFTSRPTFHPGPGTTWAEGWSARTIQSPFAPAARALLDSGLVDGSPTLVVYEDDGHFNRHLTMFAGVRNRDTGTITPPMERVDDIDGLGEPVVDVNGRITGDSLEALRELEDAIRETGFPVRVIVASEPLAVELAEFSVANPDLELRVEYLPEMRLA